MLKKDYGMYKIVVDCFGGDNSPQANVEGAVAALEKNNEFSLVLTGDKTAIENELKKHSFDNERVEILDAAEVISCEEPPTEAVKNKPESSMMKGFAALKNGADALLSTGSTGALLVGSVLKIGRVKGVSRPALAPLLPTVNDDSFVLFLDAGANADCKPVNLFHFAVMGSAYMQNVLGVKNPRVALLSNGTEEGKGSELAKAAHAALKQCSSINFVGNVEARDILSGDYDVVVTDGFSGNIAIKSMEGLAECVFSILKTEISASLKSKIGALLLKDSLKKVKGKLDYNKYGGAVFLGAKKIIVKSHGSSKPSAITAAVLQAVKALKGNVNSAIERGIEEAERDVAAFENNA